MSAASTARWNERGDPAWYAVQVRPHCEGQCEAGFQARGWEPYLPAFVEMHHWSDRQKRIRIPLFPGYLFVRLELAAPAHSAILRTPGVVRVLGGAEGAEAVPVEQLDAVRRMLDAGRNCLAHPGLVSGARVEVRGGPLRGLRGVFVRMHGAGRLVCHLEMLARSVSVEMDPCDVRPLAPAGGRHDS